MKLTDENIRRLVPKAIMPIVARVGGEWQPSGTGFFVSHYGFMLTAAHIIKPAAEKRGRILNSEGKWVDEGNFYAVFPNPDDSPAPTQFLRIKRTTIPTIGDLAFCQLPWPPPDPLQDHLKILMVRPSGPRVGERIFIFGYDEFEITNESTHSEGLSVNTKMKASAVRGHVTEIYVPIRDRVMAPFPSFTITTDTPILGGVSGAPVIDEGGYVCGIVSLSRTWDTVATCSMLSLSLGLQVELFATPHLAERKAFIWDLMREGLILSDGSWRDFEIGPTGTAAESEVFLLVDLE